MQENLQSQQAEVGRQRDQLESERRDIAGQRLRESILGPILANLGPLAVCGLALVFCSMLVYGLYRDKNGDEAVAEILIEELTSERPVLLPTASSPQLLERAEAGPVATIDQADASPDAPEG